jgi:hypothetical protein
MACQFSIRDIFGAISTRLCTATTSYANNYSANQVKLAARGPGDPLPKFSGDRDVVISFTKPFPTEGFVCGAGRLASELVRYFDVVPRTRVQSGMSDRDNNIVLNSTLGHLLSEEFVLDALHLVELFRLYDAQTQTYTYPLTEVTDAERLLTEPMRVSDGPTAYPNGSQIVMEENGVNPMYIQSGFSFEVKYLPVMS